MSGNTAKRCRRLRYLWILLGIMLAVSLGASTARIYVTNSAGTNIYVVDPVTNKVVQVIEDIELPHGVNFSPDGSRVYVSNESESVVNVVDAKSGKTIKKVRLSGHPNNIAVSKDGKRIFVCISDEPAALDVIDTTSMERVQSIPMTAKLHNVYVTPDGKYAVAGSVVGKFLVVVDTSTEKPVWNLPFDKGVRPMAFEAGPDGSTRRIFVVLSNLNGFAVVDFAKRAEVTRIQHPDVPVAFPNAAATDSPSHAIGVSPDGKTIWSGSVPSNSVFVYSLPDLKLMGRVALAEEKLGAKSLRAWPNWLTFTPDSKTAYVSNSALRSVSAIDVKTLKVVATVPVGEVPKRINTMLLP
jgi:YVTN family beta-propeller protein